MSKFDKAVAFVLGNEGGLRENKDGSDSGGTTNCGISLRFLRQVHEENLRRYGIFDEVTENTIIYLTPAQIKLIYRGEFWEGNHFDDIESQVLCSYIFDMTVMHGISHAVKLVQRATWAMTFIQNYLRDDGILGYRTVGVINALGEELLPILVATRADFCRVLVEQRPKDQVNLEGWLNRVYAPPI
jgi:lysozyme family protein